MGLILYFFFEARAAGGVGLPVAAYCANNKSNPVWFYLVRLI